MPLALAIQFVVRYFPHPDRCVAFLFQLGANIEALEEQVTRGQFSMTLQASWTPARFDRAAIQLRIREGLGIEIIS